MSLPVGLGEDTGISPRLERKDRKELGQHALQDKTYREVPTYRDGASKFVAEDRERMSAYTFFVSYT